MRYFYLTANIVRHLVQIEINPSVKKCSLLDTSRLGEMDRVTTLGAARNGGVNKNLCTFTICSFIAI